LEHAAFIAFAFNNRHIRTHESKTGA